MTDPYRLLDVERRLAEDPRTAELGVHLVEHAGRLFVRGRVSGEERRRVVLEIVREMCARADVVDELASSEDGMSSRPGHAEEIR